MHSPHLVLFAVGQIVMLLAAWGFGRAAHALLRRPTHLPSSVLTVASIIGMSLGTGLAGWWWSGLEWWSARTLLSAFVGVVGILALVSSVYAVRFADDEVPSIPTQAALGESATLELKSSARVNMVTGKRDERMEMVIVKTVAAFSNTDGGSLIIGVDDDGVPLGLDADFATLKQADPDRFELWLRDTLQARLGPNAAGLPSVDFHQLESGAYLARVRTPRSPRPVFLRPGKGRESGSELWVRVGNSTRCLPVDDAAEYISTRWPITISTAARNQCAALVQRWKKPRTGL